MLELEHKLFQETTVENININEICKIRANSLIFFACNA